MANTSAAPCQSSIHKHINRIVVEGVEHLQGYGSYPAICTDTHVSWQLVQPILAGINLLNDQNRWQAGFTKPARIELFMGADTFRTRGMAIFDETGRLIVHVVNALLGYGGSGPQLSWQILDFLGISKEMFEDIQAATSQANGTRPYTILITRNGDEWQWQHAR